MNYNDSISLIDFLNNRFKKLRQPWYVWAIEIPWEKLIKWGYYLGWKGDK